MSHAADWYLALFGIFLAAAIGDALGARLQRHADARREARDAAEQLIASTSEARYRDYARRKVWAA